jgi:hypothetical protein
MRVLLVRSYVFWGLLPVMENDNARQVLYFYTVLAVVRVSRGHIN